MSATQSNYYVQWAVIATQNTNVAATATKAAGGTNLRHFITGYSISCSAAPSATVSVTVTNGGTTVEQIEIPAAAFTPVVVNFLAPVAADANTAVAITCPAVGGTTRSTVCLRGFTMYV